MTQEQNKEVQEVNYLKEPMAVGQIFADSGMFPDVKTQAQAVVKILAGQELGLSPFDAMNNIYIVENGRLGVMANAVAAILKRKKEYDYSINKLDDTECSLTFYKVDKNENEPLGVSTFTMKDAAKAGLINKPNWKSYPRNMMFSRALANGVRWYCPDAILGYTVEEMQDVPRGTEFGVENTKHTVELTAEGKVVNGEQTVQQ